MSKYYCYNTDPLLFANPSLPIQQRWMPSLQYPYPMNFVQAPSLDNQLLINYNGNLYTQGLSIVQGPVMYPVNRQFMVTSQASRAPTIIRNRGVIAYPTNSSIPGPYLQNYINLAGQ